VTLIIAHRGASGHRPEHTPAAVRLGFALGAGAVEPDLVPTKDGVLVVRHEPEISETTDVAEHVEFAERYRTLRLDPTLLGGAGIDPALHPAETTGWFTFDFTWEELATLRARERLPQLRQHGATFTQEPLLRLADLLDLLDERERETGERPVLVAEIKHDAAFGALGYAMAELAAAELGDRVPAGKLVIESFELDVFRRLHERGLAATYVFLSVDPVADLAGLPEWIDGVSYAKHHLLGDRGPTIVAAAHARGLLVYTWTLRPENQFLEPAFRGDGAPGDWGRWQDEFSSVLATGVDGVFADHPDLPAALR